MKKKIKAIVKKSETQLRNKEVIEDFLDKQKEFRNGKEELPHQLVHVLSQEQRQMILAVVKMHEIHAEQIKTPVTRITSLAQDTDIKEAIQIIKKSGHSRLPVYEEKDGRKKFNAVLYAKDILPALTDTNKKFKISDYAREALVTPESQSILSLLTDMRQKSHHLALTVNEYGDVSGLITLEDILETIVGDIRDEFDSKVEDIQTIGEHEYLIDGNTSLLEINQEFDISLPEDKFNTLAGYLLHEFKGVISKKASIELDGIKFTIEKISGQEILRVKMQLQKTNNKSNN